jgi:NADH dehydrogenase FAD-containing subunit
MHDTRSVVIVGANIAGMTAARALAGRISAKVYEPTAALEWLPNIHELISGLKRPHNLRVERGPLLARSGHDWHRQRVVAIDPHRHQLTLEDGSEQLFSQMILAIGGVHYSGAVPGAEYAMPFKSVADCQRIGIRLQQLASRPGPMRVVIVGAGVEGVEALGEVLRRFGRRPGLSIQVIDSRERILRNLPAAVDETIRRHCASWPVAFCLGERVAALDAEQIRLQSGRSLAADIVIWTGGVGAHPLLHASHLSDDTGFASVSAELHNDHADGIYVVGDAVSRIGGTELERQAYHAIDMARVAAANVLASRAGRALRSYRAALKPQLITFGELDTFMVSGKRVIASPSLRTLKEAIYQAGIAGFDHRRRDRRLWGLWRRILDSGIDAGIDSLRHPATLLGWTRVRILE